MKKFVVASAAIIICLLIAGTASTQSRGMSEKAKKNLANSKAIAKMFEAGDFSKAGNHIAADAVDHSGPMGEVKGLDNMKAMFSQFSQMASNSKSEVVQELANDDYSMIWLKQSWTAKMDDPMMGLKAGDRATMQSIEVCKHGADGKITDHWSFMSMSDVMKMITQAPADKKKDQ